MGKNTKFAKARFNNCDNRKFYLGGNRRTVAAILNANPFIGDKPDERISLCVYADERGLRYWNDKKDPMPFKTINNNGLKIWEETEDYIIYIDKDAITTTVEKYVVGSYQIFMERMKDIERSNELIKSYNIEWTSEDNSKLFIQINNESLEKLEQSPMLLPEDTIQIVLDPKTVPTSYDCCFTVRKDDNYSLYINDGYENLFGTKVYSENWADSGNSTIKPTFTSDKWSFNFYTGDGIGNNRYFREFKVDPDTDYCYSLKYTHSELPNNSIVFDKTNNYKTILTVANMNENFKFRTPLECVQIRVHHGYAQADGEVGRLLSGVKLQITKTKTSKPFIKSIQPNCKVVFDTNATSGSHSFIIKNMFIDKNISTSKIPLSHKNNAGGEYVGLNSIFSESYLIFSSIYTQPNIAIQNKGIAVDNLQLNYWDGNFLTSLSQLLIYKNDERGGMTQAELDIELAKDIRLK